MTTTSTRADHRTLPVVLQQYEIEEERLRTGKLRGKLRVTVSPPEHASATERVFFAPRGYDRRALLWRAHNSISPPPRRPRQRFKAPRRPEGQPYWQAKLDHLAKQAGWKPDWESRGYYTGAFGSVTNRFGNAGYLYGHITSNGLGVCGRIDVSVPEVITSDGLYFHGEAFHTNRTAALLEWLRAKRFEYREGGAH